MVPLSNHQFTVGTTRSSSSSTEEAGESNEKNGFQYADLIENVEQQSSQRTSSSTSSSCGKHGDDGDDDDDNDSVGSTESSSSMSEDEMDSPPKPLRRSSKALFTSSTSSLLPPVPRTISTTSSSTSRRRIQFDIPIEKRQYIESHKDYSRKERRKSWYSRSEKQKMMQKIERVVLRMEDNKPPRKNQTYRGLETWTAAGAARLDLRISTCVNQTMDEQDRQWKCHTDDYDKIAEVSRNATGDSKVRARLIGLQDEEEAFKVRNQPWIEDDDMSVSVNMAAAMMGETGKKSKAKIKKWMKMQEKRDKSPKKLKKSKKKSRKAKEEMSDLEKYLTLQAGGTSDSKKSKTDRSTKSSKSSKSNKSKSDKEQKSKKLSFRDDVSSSSSKKKIKKADKKKSSKVEDHGKKGFKKVSRKKQEKVEEECTTSLEPISDVSDVSFNVTSKNALDKVPEGTPTTSPSSSAVSLNEEVKIESPLLIALRRRQMMEGGSTTTYTVQVGESPRSSDPPGRRARRNRSKHCDDTLLTMRHRAQTLRAMERAASVPRLQAIDGSVVGNSGSEKTRHRRNSISDLRADEEILVPTSVEIIRIIE